MRLWVGGLAVRRGNELVVGKVGKVGKEEGTASDVCGGDLDAGDLAVENHFEDEVLMGR